MFSSFKKDLPYGYGIFNQQFKNLKLVWSYGQYGCYSSLLLKIPSENITLTLLANNNLLSNPARLINGDATSSLFVLSFLKNYMLGLTDMPLFEKQDAISEGFSNNEFFRKKILGQALAESYMARFNPEKLQSSVKLLKHVFTKNLNYLEYADLNLLHTLLLLKDAAHSEFNDFDTQIETIGKKLLEQEPNNPYIHSYLGTFYSRKGNKEKAKYHFESIVNAKNFSENWYIDESKKWLTENK
ncbi:tetratricopeptide repeat protein [Polaribacter batillariae]|uniref:Tetratricopeptide repeat protein n=1 Tax=Polaribacter batillariae TaxID=2808900 RepID=A0ABX7SR92_9FLAO|nr:tetratricopeptide repeat protein [Polaribacter batillariae]QTD36755.1 tetratricopeptide repeat protein [Polaribacter batillariae]